jgi:hypothetical protein
MKFNNKTEAYDYLKEKNLSNQELTVDEVTAIKEFFSQDELNDLSFIEFKIEECFNFDPTDL